MCPLGSHEKPFSPVKISIWLAQTSFADTHELLLCEICFIVLPNPVTLQSFTEKDQQKNNLFFISVRVCFMSSVLEIMLRQHRPPTLALTFLNCTNFLWLYQGMTVRKVLSCLSCRQGATNLMQQIMSKHEVRKHRTDSKLKFLNLTLKMHPREHDTPFVHLKKLNVG